MDDVFVLGVHLIDAMADDRSQFVSERGVPCSHGRVGVGHQERVAVLVLEAFSIEGGSSGSCTHQETTGALIGCRPNEVSDTLEPEHRVEGVERHGWVVVRGIRSCRGDERRGCPCFIDAFFQELAFGRFLVLHQYLVINWLVQLSFWMVDAKFSEQWIHTEGSGFIRNDWDNSFAEALVFHQGAQNSHKRHGC